jgi:hypothetical protein
MNNDLRNQEIVLLLELNRILKPTMSKYTIPFVILAALLIGKMGYSQKIDTIYHINGNILTGDFKRMNYGVVSWSMDGMGTISLEEPKINTIKSVKQFEIKLKDGLIYFGSFDTSGVAEHVYIVITNGREHVKIDEIVEVYPIRRNFWMRTSGTFSLGLNYTKGSDVFQSNLAGNISYRKQVTYWNLSWDSNNTWQGDSITATKVDVELAYQRLFRKGWSFGAAIGANQNLELGTRLRLNLTPMIIRDVVYNYWNRFWVGAGISPQREYGYTDAGPLNDLVGLFTAVWKVYKYTNPKVWVDASINFLPYFTGESRYRANVNLAPKVGLVGNDFQIGFSFYYSWDSRPPNDASTGTDWGINLQITYKLHP